MSDHHKRYKQSDRYLRREIDVWLPQTERAGDAWFLLEPLTLLFPYLRVQNEVANALAPYSHVIADYRKATGRTVKPVSEEYLTENAQVAEQNVVLLKNAIELWRTATRVSDSTAPILLHYSWHCFNAFMSYSMLRWEPEHAGSHGITPSFGESLKDMKIMIKRDGLFQRLIDTWTILGAPLVFSRKWPIIENKEIVFVKGDTYLPDQKNEILVEQLLEFDSSRFEREVNSKRYAQLVQCPFLSNSVQLPNSFIQDYLTVFAVSSIARYRPVLWHQILRGETEGESRFCLRSSEAALNYTLGEHRSLGFALQVWQLLNRMEKQAFGFNCPDGSPVRKDGSS